MTTVSPIEIEDTEDDSTAVAAEQSVLPRKYEPVYPVSVLAVLLIGGALRLWGISFGLPNLYHWDEKMYFHGAFYALATGGKAESLVYGNVPYLLLPIYWLVALFHGIWLDANGLSRLITVYLEDPSPFFLFGRWAWVGLQLVAIWLCYRTGWRALSRRAGLVGAGFLAISFLSVSEGHYVKGDSTAMLGAILVAWSAVHLIRQPSLAWYAVVGGAAGLSVAFKPYTFTLLLVPVVAHLLAWVPFRAWLTRSWCLLVSAVAAAATFLITLPAPLVDPMGTWATFRVEAAARLANVPTGGQPIWLYYWTGHLWEGIGWPLVLLGLGGFALWLFRHDRNRILLLAIPVLLWVGIVSRSNGFARYALPIVPFVCLAAGDVLDAAATRLFVHIPALKGLHRRLVLGVALAVVSLLVALPSLIRDVDFGTYAASPDTRSAAANWIEANIPAGSSIVEEGGQGFEATSTIGPPLRPSASANGQTWVPASLKPPVEFWSKPLLSWLETYTPTYRLMFAPTLTRRGEITSTAQWGEPNAFVMISWRSDPEKELPASPFWDDLKSKYKLAARFDCSPCLPNDPYAWAVDYDKLAEVQPLSGSNRAGPRVWIYTKQTAGP